MLLSFFERKIDPLKQAAYFFVATAAFMALAWLLNQTGWYTVDHLFLNEELRKNITTTYYHGGHMMYTMKSELIKLTDEVKKFYDGFGS